MLFWIICLALVLLASLPMVLALGRRDSISDTDSTSDLTIYRDQLEEIERDLIRGVLAQDEAERSRIEVSRRILAADATTSDELHTAPVQLSKHAAAGAALALLLGSFGLYAAIGAPGYRDLPLELRLAESEEFRANRRSQTEAEAAQIGIDAPINASEDYLAIVTQLRDVMADRPDDLRGWQLLAQHEAALGNFAAAKTAQTRVLALKGDATTPADRLAWVDRAVAAAGGEVSPETEAQLRLILETSPQSYGARYYTGLLYAQTDRADIAFRFWRPLVEDGPQTPHTDLARAQIEDAAYLAGIDYTVPPANMLDSATLEAAEEMAPEDRAEMIQGMVAGLADRLANEGGGPQDWARLIRAYGVLGDTAAASEVWNEAQSTFAANLEAMTSLRAAAQSAGVLE